MDDQHSPSRAAAALSERLGGGAFFLGCLCFFVGRIVMWPVAVAPGGFVDRLRAEPDAWRWSHALLIAGALLLLPGTLAVGRALRHRLRWLVAAGVASIALACMLGIGQYALDFSYLQATALPDDAARAIIDSIHNEPIVRTLFYDIANPAWLGLGALAVAMLAQRDRVWAVAGAFLLASVGFGVFDASFGPIGPRITLGLQCLGGGVAAYRMAKPG